MADAATTILRDLIALPTVSSASNLPMIDYLANRFADVGADVEIFASPCGHKANLFATLGPMVDGGLVLSGHTDVVPTTGQAWQRDPFTATVTDDRVYGRGSCDMKGFIACMLATLPEMSRLELKRPIHFALTYDEELGCIGAGHLMTSLSQHSCRPRLALIGEPTQMQVVDGHKSCHEYTVTFTGTGGHGARPDLGVSAVAVALQYAARLLELGEALKSRAKADSPFSPPYTTLNIGLISGGNAHNVIADRCELGIDLRPIQDADAQFVLQELERYCVQTLLPKMHAISQDTGIELEVIAQVQGLEPRADNAARDLLFRVTGAGKSDVVPFVTEAGLFQRQGLDCVVCGPGSIEQAHKADEFVSRSQLAACEAMLTGVTQTFAQEA